MITKIKKNFDTIKVDTKYVWKWLVKLSLNLVPHIPMFG
jgi:hypothetical protein